MQMADTIEISKQETKPLTEGLYLLYPPVMENQPANCLNSWRFFHSLLGVYTVNPQRREDFNAAYARLHPHHPRELNTQYPKLTPTRRNTPP